MGSSKGDPPVAHPPAGCAFPACRCCKLKMFSSPILKFNVKLGTRVFRTEWRCSVEPHCHPPHPPSPLLPVGPSRPSEPGQLLMPLASHLLGQHLRDESSLGDTPALTPSPPAPVSGPLVFALAPGPRLSVSSSVCLLFLPVVSLRTFPSCLRPRRRFGILPFLAAQPGPALLPRAPVLLEPMNDIPVSKKAMPPSSSCSLASLWQVTLAKLFPGHPAEPRLGWQRLLPSHRHALRHLCASSSWCLSALNQGVCF